MNAIPYLCLTMAAAAAAHGATPCTGTTRLFDAPLRCATRTSFQAAVHKAGLGITREDPHYKCDVYASRSVLNGSDELLVCYTEAGNLAAATYQFPAFVDASQVTKVRALVESKYGGPATSDGNARVGAVTYSWDRPDGVTIVVWRGWPDTTVYLSFRSNKAYPAFQREIDAAKAAERKAASDRQADAF